MDITSILTIFILCLAILFFIILITSSLILLQILASLKRILGKGEDFIDNLERNQEEIKIKILDFTENILTRFKKSINAKLSLPKGGETDDKKEKAK